MEENDNLFSDSFYSSHSMNNSEHARNLRNSVIFDGSSENPSPERNTYQTGNTNVDVSGTDASVDYASHLHGSSDETDEPSSQTKTLKMTPSPSLSALAGILNEKSKRADEKMKQGLGLAGTIVEEDFGEPANYNPNSPNLIDIDDHSPENFSRQYISDAYSTREHQPDFLNTPKTEPPTPRVEPTEHSFTHEGSSVDANSSTMTTERQERVSVSVLPRKSTVSNETSSKRSVSDSAKPQKAEQPKAERAKEKKKKKSLLSFLKRKPPKSRSFVVEDTKQQNSLPTSSTFSVANSSGDDRKDAIRPTAFTKRSQSNGSIFNTFRKSKEASQAAVDQPFAPQKRKSQVLPKSDVHLEKKQGPDQSIQKRKPTPLNFEQITPKSDPLPPPPKPSVSVELPPAAEVRPKNDAGEALFPKSLSAQEVESIVSLERSRSLRSNKRGSPMSNRRSFTDNISVNAQQEGMFITPASDIVISTPDLTKSPTSSILRNGTFDSSDLHRNLSGKDSINTGYLDQANGSTKSPSLLQERDFSFTSVENKINGLSLESPQRLKASPKSPVRSQPTGPRRNDTPDVEFMSDIMEFANIIDFGNDIDLSLDFEDQKYQYGSLNPSLQKKDYPLSKPDTGAADLFNFESSRPYSWDREIPPEQSPEATNQRGRSHNLAPLAETSALFNDEDEHEFEGEDFNQAEQALESPTIQAYIPQTAQTARPLSLSFRGLRQNYMESPTISSFQAPMVINGEFSGSSSFSKKGVTFSSRIVLFTTYAEDEYDRHPEIATCNQLTPQLAQMIKDELNTLKSEMEIHEDSQRYTHYF
ncbi:LAMI_0F14950g1_1 [Lachancea mirantina]|uniref:LAMI_0F14950g1_1 n=1 Tax=Lachancea mirantina TaxID=1230905 RepID=A0A1G4K453_9SACH|nr:LAMI_0F14950g1_1 [Lachancea mirantina]